MLHALSRSLSLLHSRPIATKDTCERAFQHDQTVQILSIALIVGLILSYVPQVSALPILHTAPVYTAILASSASSAASWSPTKEGAFRPDG